MAQAILTPCIKVCRMAQPADECEGCGRTLAEIAAWAAMTDAQRAAIMQRLALRKGRSRDAAPAY